MLLSQSNICTMHVTSFFFIRFIVIGSGSDRKIVYLYSRKYPLIQSFTLGLHSFFSCLQGVFNVESRGLYYALYNIINLPPEKYNSTIFIFFFYREFIKCTFYQLLFLNYYYYNYNDYNNYFLGLKKKYWKTSYKSL